MSEVVILRALTDAAARLEKLAAVAGPNIITVIYSQSFVSCCTAAVRHSSVTSTKNCSWAYCPAQEWGMRRGQQQAQYSLGCQDVAVNDGRRDPAAARATIAAGGHLHAMAFACGRQA